MASPKHKPIVIPPLSSRYTPIIIPPTPKYIPIVIPEIPRSPSPRDSFDSTSSSSTLVDMDPTPSERPSLSLNTSPSVLCPYSTNGSRNRRGSPPQIILGAIDEMSGHVQPDVPLSADKESSLITKLHAYASAPSSKKKPTIASTAKPPRNEFEVLVGPNGERFMDVRMNRKAENAKSGSVLKRLLRF